jgi:hypothetical protein
MARTVSNMADEMTNVRNERIDAAVSAAGDLIGLLLTEGPVNSQQAKLIVEGVVRAVVPNFEGWEIRDSARRVVAEIGAKDASPAG